MFAKPRRAFSLLEAVLGCLLMSILSAVCFSALRGGMWATQRGALQAEVVQNAQVMLASLSACLQSGTLPGLTIETGGAAFSVLDSQPQSGARTYDASGRVVWERYNIAYFSAAEKTLRIRYLPLIGSAPERLTPGPLPSYNGGSGAQPLSSYLHDGQVVGRNLSACQFNLEGSRVVIRFTCQKVGVRNNLEKVETTTSVMLRN